MGKILFLFLMLGSAIGIWAQSSSLLLYNNEKLLCSLNVVDNIEIAIANDEITFLSSSSKYVFKFSDISKYVFQENSEAGNILTQDVKYSINNNILYVPALNRPYSVHIYSILGNCLYSIESDGTEVRSINLSELNMRIVIINMFGISFKVVI